MTSVLVPGGRTLLRSLPVTCCGASSTVPRRHLRIFPSQPPFDNTRFPERYRLPVMPKTPLEFQDSMVKSPKATKELFRMFGEEEVHNKLVLGQYGIVALAGGAFKHAHFEAMRNYSGRFLEEGRSFAIYRIDAPFKACTKRSGGKKLGGGKGSITHYTSPVKAGRVIMEVGGKVLWEEVQPWLSKLCEKLPVRAMAVSQELLERLDAEEKRLEEVNENPYTFEWLVRNNMFDCHRFLSPRDRKFFGRFVYRDRTLNLKWNSVLQNKYKHR